MNNLPDVWIDSLFTYYTVTGKTLTDIQNLIRSCQRHLDLLDDAEENIHPTTGKELADVKELRRCLKKLGFAK